MADKNPNEIGGDAIAEQLQGTTSEDAGGNVSGTEDDDAGFEIVFEPEDEQ